MRSAKLGLCLVVLTAASCGFPRLSELVDGGGGADGSNISDGATNDGATNDGATNDGGPLPWSLELLAGDIGGPGNVDGTSALARFNFSTGVAVDSAGSVYVAEPVDSRRSHRDRGATGDGNRVHAPVPAEQHPGPVVRERGGLVAVVIGQPGGAGPAVGFLRYARPDGVSRRARWRRTRRAGDAAGSPRRGGGHRLHSAPRPRHRLDLDGRAQSQRLPRSRHGPLVGARHRRAAPDAFLVRVVDERAVAPARRSRVLAAHRDRALRAARRRRPVRVAPLAHGAGPRDRYRPHRHADRVGPVPRVVGRRHEPHGGSRERARGRGVCAGPTDPDAGSHGQRGSRRSLPIARRLDRASPEIVVARAPGAHGTAAGADARPGDHARARLFGRAAAAVRAQSADPEVYAMLS